MSAQNFYCSVNLDSWDFKTECGLWPCSWEDCELKLLNTVFFYVKIENLMLWEKRKYN